MEGSCDYAEEVWKSQQGIFHQLTVKHGVKHPHRKKKCTNVIKGRVLTDVLCNILIQV
jgi:hypothetical protein